MVEVVDENYLIVMEVVEEDCSMNIHVRFDITINNALIIEFERWPLDLLDQRVHG